MNRPTPKSRLLELVLGLGLVVLSSCGGKSSIEARHASVQNTMLTMGLVPTIPVSRFSLGKGEAETLPFSAEAGACSTVVAVGEGSASDLVLEILDSAGVTVAEEVVHDTQASLQFCPSTDGRFTIRVQAVGGSAKVLLSAYRGGDARGRGMRTAHRDSSCEGALPIRPNERIAGSNASGQSMLSPSCGQGGAPEQIYVFELTEPSRATIMLEATFDAILSIRTGCADGHEVACNDDYGDAAHARVDANLGPGVYYVVVDGFPGQVGEFSLELRLTEVKTEAEICASVEELVPGQPTQGDNSASSYSFQATCAQGANGPEDVRRLHIDRKSRVRITQQSDFDGVLHVRSVCDRVTTEIACNDDFDGYNRSLVTAVLDPGDYYVISDGFGQDRPSSGTYLVLAETTTAQGRGAEADACGAPGVLNRGEPTITDTFEAADDFQGSCGGAGAPDTVFRLDVPVRSRVRVRASSAQFDGLLYVRDACEGGREHICKDFPMSRTPVVGGLEVNLDRGAYHLVVDGQRPDAFGSVQLDVSTVDLVALERDCNSAPILVPGRVVSGTTSGREDRFHASCAGEAQSGDAVYRIRLKKRSHVEIKMTTDFDGALHLRRSCTDDASEIACNDDDNNSNRASKVEATLEPGTYFVVVDGFRVGSEGNYELSYSVREL